MGLLNFIDYIGNLLIKEKPEIKWIEVNAKILQSEFFRHTFGVSPEDYKRKESRRKVMLTLEIPMLHGENIIVSKKDWTYTKSRGILQEGMYVAILYNEANPAQFKLKYDL